MAGEAGELAIGGGVPAAAVCGAGDCGPVAGGLARVRGLSAGGVTTALFRATGGIIAGVLGGAAAGRVYLDYTVYCGC